MILLIDLLDLDLKDLAWYQMINRKIIVFLLAMAFIRISGMGTFGTSSAFDVVVSITLGGILGRFIMGHYPFFASLGAAAALVALHRPASILSSRNKKIGYILEGNSIELFKDGQKQESLMKQYDINDKELLTAITKKALIILKR